jgi:hypothetical protein
MEERKKTGGKGIGQREEADQALKMLESTGNPAYQNDNKDDAPLGL